MVENLLEQSKEQLDATYARGMVSKIPTGSSKGTAVFFPGKTALNKVVSKIARPIWAGKVISEDGSSLKNKVLGAFRSFQAQVYRGPSWYDGKESIIIDYAKTSFSCQRIRDEMREIAPNLYLGRAYIRKQPAGQESTSDSPEALANNGILAVYFILEF
ncbi:MAG: hypothetical protein JST16_14135 [Bdellovibrionales bacterium]|nr:hypothetical protein [Bdellovibrionales bacterium]